MPERESFRVRAAAERSDDHVRVTLRVTLPDGVHIEPHQPTDPYLIPTVLAVEGVEDLAITYPRPVVKDLGWNGLALTVLEGALDFVVTGRVPADTTHLTGTLAYQPCVGGACLPPRTVNWEAPTAGVAEYSVLDALAAW